MAGCENCEKLTKDLAKAHKKIQIDDKRNTRKKDEPAQCTCAVPDRMSTTALKSGYQCTLCGGEA